MTICHIIYLSSIIKERKINKIIFDGCEQRFVDSLCSAIKINNVIKINIKTKEKKSLFIKQLFFFSRTLIKLIYLKLFFSFPSEIKQKINKLFLARYPKHFNENFQHEKYGSLFEKELLFSFDNH